MIKVLFILVVTNLNSQRELQWPYIFRKNINWRLLNNLVKITILYFHTALSMVPFPLYQLHWKAGALKYKIHICSRERSNLQLLKMKRNTAIVTRYAWNFKINQKKRNLDKLIKRFPVIKFIFRQSCCLQACNFTKTYSSSSIVKWFCSDLKLYLKVFPNFRNRYFPEHISVAASNHCNQFSKH